MTSPIPLSKDEVHSFTPASLENIVPTPSFRFRPATERDKRRYGHLLASEGLRVFPKEQMRAEMLATLEKNWSPDDFREQSAHLLTIFTKMDQEIDVSDDEVAWVASLTMSCMDVSPLLRRMDADTRRFNDEAPSVALSMFLGGWSNVPTPFRLEAGIVPYETMNQLRRDIETLEKQALEDKVDGVTPGLSYMLLTLHAFKLLNLDEEAEKNSSAPSPSSDTPNGSKTTSRKGGKSRAGARPTNSRRAKTRANSSRAKQPSS